MKCTHSVKLNKLEVPLEDIYTAVALYDIPLESVIKEDDENYDLVIEWEEGD